MPACWFVFQLMPHWKCANACPVCMFFKLQIFHVALRICDERTCCSKVLKFRLCIVTTTCPSFFFFFLHKGKFWQSSNYHAIGCVLIKRWERLGIPWEAHNRGRAMFLWYPEQKALGNQIQLNSQPPITHTQTQTLTHTIIWQIFGKRRTHLD